MRASVVSWPAARPAALALALYVLLRAVGVVTLAAFADHAGQDVWLLLSNTYDAGWYKNVATAGYDHGVGMNGLTNLVFFPLYPGLIAALDPVLGGGPEVSGLAVSWLAGVVAAWGLFAIGNHLRDRRTGVALAALWAVIPHAVVESMAYTETLFTALSAWSLYAVLTRRWLTAGGLCLVAGLVRPTSAALVAAVGLACLVAAVRRTDGWRPWLAGALAPLGLLGYLTFVADRLHRPDGYFHVQDAIWRMPFDGGRYTVETVGEVFTRRQPLQLYAVTAVLLVSVVLFALSVRARQQWPLLVFSGGLLVLSIGGGGYYHSKARLLIPAFGLLLPVATALAGLRVRAAVAVFALLALGSAGFGSYLCLGWKYSP
jgi:Dolichyl-phosphate-mannose-protein mannosyltransferase